MKDITLWLRWYGILLTMPLMVAGLFLRGWMARSIRQQSAGHH